MRGYHNRNYQVFKTKELDDSTLKDFEDDTYFKTPADRRINQKAVARYIEEIKKIEKTYQRGVCSSRYDHFICGVKQV